MQGTRYLPAIFVAIVLLGCDRTPTQSARTNSNPPAPMAASESERAAFKSDIAASTTPKPAADASQPRVAPAPHPTPTAGALKFDPPADWKSTPPKTAMRKAQFLIPRAEGDKEDGEAMMFDSTSLSGGGSADANITRWREMMTSAKGTPLGDDAAKVEKLDHSGFKFTFLDASGTYTPAAMGGPAQEPNENYRMLAAVVEAGGEERYFIRATGPAATMAKQVDAFRAYVLSAKR